MWSAAMESVATGLCTVNALSNPAWRSRDLPPSPQLSEKMLKVTDWLNRGSAGRYIRAVDDPRYKDQAGDHARGHTFLMQAVISNNEELVAALLARGADPNQKAGGKSALHFAAILGHSNAVKLLLLYGASTTLRVDEDDTDYTECDGLTALEIVEEKIEFARDPLRERLAESREMLIKAAAEAK